MRSRSRLACSALSLLIVTGAGLGALPAWATDIDAELAAIQGKILGHGPHGEIPVPGSSIQLTDEEISKVKAMKATAAIVMHYGGNDWSQAQIDGQKAEFARLGIEVLAVTDAGFKPDKQVSDIETVMARKPNIIVSIPTDPAATAAAYKQAAAAGVKLVFIGNVPPGMEQGKDYVSVVGSDDFGNGMVAGLLMAKSLGGKGNIGAVFHAADFFVTRDRYAGFKAAIAKFPDMKLIAEQGIGGPDFPGDAEKAASAMLTTHKDIDAIWAVWDVPAEGVLAAARGMSKSGVQIFTEDLGLNVALDMAKNGMVKGLGGQVPYDQGVTEARLAAYGLLGKPAPAAVALGALPVTKANLLDAWKAVYHADAPAKLLGAMQ